MPSVGLRTIDARGMTDLGGGWLRGCEMVASELLDLGVNRTLLLTDGLANQGITTLEELEHHAAQLRKRGVSTSTFGVGDSFNEVLLQAMAQAGGGQFYDIASAAPESATISRARSARPWRSWRATQPLMYVFPASQSSSR